MMRDCLKSEIIELENKLNKEYKEFGVITIKSMFKKSVDISDIEYVKKIMDEVGPIKSEEPVVLARNYVGDKSYKIIDGYHRTKHKILNGELTIDAYDLGYNYIIDRKSDTLFSFMESLIGKTVKFVDDYVLNVGDSYYSIVANEGCGGCSNGRSSVELVDDFVGKDVSIEKVEQVLREEDDDDYYDLLINGKKVAEVNTGWGNGYYGGDFDIGLLK